VKVVSRFIALDQVNEAALSEEYRFGKPDLKRFNLTGWRYQAFHEPMERSLKQNLRTFGRRLLLDLELFGRNC
jgi:isochorismate hydrolase